MKSVIYALEYSPEAQRGPLEQALGCCSRISSAAVPILPFMLLPIARQGTVRRRSGHAAGGVGVRSGRAAGAEKVDGGDGVSRRLDAPSALLYECAAAEGLR